jgi:hypothetical protein
MVTRLLKTHLINKSTKPIILRRRRGLQLLSLQNTHVNLRLVRARLEVLLLEKEAELGNKHISAAFADNTISEQGPFLPTRQSSPPRTPSLHPSRRLSHSAYLTASVVGRKHRRHGAADSRHLSRQGRPKPSPSQRGFV